MISALGAMFRDDTIEFLKLINSRQGDEINYLREQNKILLNKLVNPDRTYRGVDNPDFEPVGKGYVPLRDRIKEAELQSLNQSIEDMEES